MIEVRTFDKAVIDKEKLFATFEFDKLRFAGKAVNFDVIGAFFYRH